MTELGEIPEEWEVRQLEDVCEILDSYRKPIKASDREEMKGDIPYYGASGVIDWVNDYIFDEELILLGEDGENLNSRNTNLAFKVSGKSWVNNHAHVFKIADKSRDNIDFMVYYLEYKDYSKYIAGSAQPKITQAQCRKFLLPSPDLEEQEKIASILSTVDEQIDNVNGLIEKNKELKKGLMQQLLTKGIGHTKFKKSEVGEIPEEWEVRKLCEICEVKGGKRLPKGYQLEDNNNGLPYVRVADMYMGGIRLDDIKFVPEDVVDKIKNYTISKDDLFISVAGTLGIVGEVPEELDEANLTENADKLCNIKINKRYLMKVLQSEQIQNVIESEKTTSAQPKLALTRIKEFIIPIPLIEEQRKISEILIMVDSKIEEYEGKKQKLEVLKKGLMQQLLTGKLRCM